MIIKHMRPLHAIPYLALAITMLLSLSSILDHRATATVFKRQAQSPAQSLAVPVAFKIQDVKWGGVMGKINYQQLKGR